MSFTKLDYCQYLLSSQINYTLTNMAEHLQSWSHDTINRYLKGEKLSPHLLFEQVQPLLESDPQAYLVFDYQSGRTIYQIKHGLLQDYLVQQLKSPTVQMVLA